MENLSDSNRRFSRRDIIKSLITIPTLLLSLESIANSQEIQRYRFKNNPQDYCNVHFKQPPNTITNDDGTFYRVKKDIYKDNNGNLYRFDIAKPLRISMEVSENRWIDFLNGNPWNTWPGFGDNPDYKMRELKISLGYARWESLTKSIQDRTERVFLNHPKDIRKWICDCYNWTEKIFYQELDDNDKTRFKKFVNAYRHAIDNSSEQDDFSPQLKIFKRYSKNVSSCYDENFPWICLSLPTVGDRAIIFTHERNKHNNGERFNWDYINEHS